MRFSFYRSDKQINQIRCVALVQKYVLRRVTMLFGLCLMIVAVVQGDESKPVDIRYTLNVQDQDVTKLRTNDYKSYYKILTRKEGDKIYIGGREELLIINSDDLTVINNVTVPNETPEDVFIPCNELVGPENAGRLCQNYIRLAEDLNSSTILVCGTNSYSQMCKLISVDGEKYTLEEPSIPAEGKVQYAVDQNTTALFNEADGRLFIGHNQGSQLNPSFISFFTVNSATPALVEVGQTNHENEKYINEPSFVGKPYRHKGFIYFFYRETAVEVVNQGKFIYSRVGRVCENDTTSGLNTFFKARLNCSLQGTFPFYFDYLQDVIVEESSDGPIFYAVFTTTPDGPSSSAICSYRMSDIIDIFTTSKFKGRPATGKLPGPIDRPSYVDEFLGCSSNTLNAVEREFQEDYALMDELVPNFNARNQVKESHPPLFFTQMNIYSIAHDKQEDIFYVGTEHGTILKAVPDAEGPGWYVYQQELSDVKYPITGLHFSNETQSLLVVNDRGVYRVDVASCRALCVNECEKSFSPYCEVRDDTCVSVRNPMKSQVMSKVHVRILTFDEPEATLESCHSRRVELTCEVKGSEACGAVNLTWSFGKEELVSCIEEEGCVGENSTLAPFVQYQEISSHSYYKLVHLSVDVYEDHTTGNFICSDSLEKSTSVKVTTHNSQGCLTRAAYGKRERRNSQLKIENRALTECNDQTSSESILFQTCNQCPGDVRVRDSPGGN